jgi:Ser/Thr protein kinase RdoA (MazF antagonist)
MTPSRDGGPAAFSTLEPGGVLDALDALGLRPDGRLLQLNSYENRVFQAHLEDADSVVAKFYRPGRWSDAQILEEHAFARELAADDVPVVAPRVLDRAAGAQTEGDPPTLGRLTIGTTRYRVAVADRHGGRGPELDDPAVLEWLGRFLARLHAIGARRRFEHRGSFSPAAGRAARQRLLDGEVLGESELPAWQAVSAQALALVEAAFERHGPPELLRIHGDFHPGNVMWREVSAADRGPHVVDLDDACNGLVVQDLWMLLSGDSQVMREQLAHVLAGYRVFRSFDAREAWLVEPLRTLRMIAYSAWIAERWHDPAFPAAFPWFGTPSYWSQQTVQLREQIELMRDPPALF